jgi:hypothetical protein
VYADVELPQDLPQGILKNCATYPKKRVCDREMVEKKVRFEKWVRLLLGSEKGKAVLQGLHVGSLGRVCSS